MGGRAGIGANGRTETRGRILEAAYALFYRKGISRVSVDAIAEAAGVTKRTVYYHFASKDDIIADVLEVQHLHLMGQFQEWIGDPSDPVEGKIERLFTRLADWAETPGWLGSGFSRISTELADLPGHPARKAASSHKRAIEDWLAARMEEDGCHVPKELARQVMILIEGGMSLSLIHGTADYVRAASGAALKLVTDRSR